MTYSKPKKLFFYSVSTVLILLLIYNSITSRIDRSKANPVLVPTRYNKIEECRSTVAIVQSSKENARDLNYDDIYAMVEDAVEKAGGFEDVIHDGDAVVLKPNLMCLWIRSTEEILKPEVNGVTTDWRVTKAVVQLVRKYNPNGKVYILEGSAFQQSKMAFDSLNYTHDYIPGVDEFIYLEESGGYEEWDAPELITASLPDGAGLYPDYMKPNKSKEFYYNRIYYEADVVISMPVLKNHTHTGLTGALKNVGIGASPPNIYGSQEIFTATGATPASIAGKYGKRIRLERTTKINHLPYYLGMWIHDYFLCRPVNFVITDGLQGLQNGPDISNLTGKQTLEKNQMNMRLILAGKDALAVDAVHSLIIGLDPYRINHLVLLSNKKIGCMDPAYIKIVGKKVHEVKKPFEMNYERGAYTLYKDFSPPQLKIDAANVQENKLHLSLSVNPRKISKVEIAVDGSMLDQTVMHSFDNISMEAGKLEQGEHKITVYAYDRYLNCARDEVIIK